MVKTHMMILQVGAAEEDGEEEEEEARKEVLEVMEQAAQEDMAGRAPWMIGIAMREEMIPMEEEEGEE